MFSYTIFSLCHFEDFSQNCSENLIFEFLSKALPPIPLSCQKISSILILPLFMVFLVLYSVCCFFLYGVRPSQAMLSPSLPHSIQFDLYLSLLWSSIFDIGQDTTNSWILVKSLPKFLGTGPSTGTVSTFQVEKSLVIHTLMGGSTTEYLSSIPYVFRQYSDKVLGALLHCHSYVKPPVFA